jgi:hypothetical protein
LQEIYELLEEFREAFATLEQVFAQVPLSVATAWEVVAKR